MKRAKRASRMRAVAAMACVVLYGCGQLLGVDDYGVTGGAEKDARSPGGQSEGGTRDASSNGKLPDGGYRSPNRACGDTMPAFTPECAACADSDPAACPAIEACLDDATCGAFTKCLDACGLFMEMPDEVSEVPNPGCMLYCRDTTFGGQDNSFPHSMNVLADGKGCAYGACSAGTRWKCVGNYVWPVALVSTAHVVLAIPGIVSAKLCDGTLGCPTEAGSGPPGGDSGSAGRMELDVPTSSVAIFGSQPHFEFTANDSVFTFLFYPGHPIVADETLNTFAKQSDAVGQLLLEAKGILVDPMKAILTIAPVADCTGVWAPGVALSVDGATDGGFYFTGTFPISLNSERVTGPRVNGAIFPNLDPGPAGRLIVTVDATVQGKKVASEQVEIRSGAVTILQLYPSPKL